jgi:hypothetical protein
MSDMGRMEVHGRKTTEEVAEKSRTGGPCHWEKRDRLKWVVRSVGVDMRMLRHSMQRGDAADGTDVRNVTWTSTLARIGRDMLILLFDTLA